MPFCTICGDGINVEGFYCETHKPSKTHRPALTQSATQFYPDPANNNGTWFPGGSSSNPAQASPGGMAPPQPRASQTAVSINNNNNGPRDFGPLMKTMKDFNTDYNFNSVTIDPNSETCTVQMNNDRVRCWCCRSWLANRDGLMLHFETYNSMCYEHRRCFDSIENVVHAKHHKHDRCFVPNCDSDYAVDDGWPNEKIIQHVKSAHRYRNAGKK